MRRMLPVAIGFVAGFVTCVRGIKRMCVYYGVEDEAHALLETIKGRQRASKRTAREWTQPPIDDGVA